jgi:hypothetical protein
VPLSAFSPITPQLISLVHELFPEKPAASDVKDKVVSGGVRGKRRCSPSQDPLNKVFSVVMKLSLYKAIL